MLRRILGGAVFWRILKSCGVEEDLGAAMFRRILRGSGVQMDP